MADINTIARPYAKAAFEVALDAGKLEKWQDLLSLLAVVASDKNMQPLLSNPNIPSEKLAELLIDICGAKKVDEYGQNFLRLLAQNKRLNALPSIFLAYEDFKAEHEKSVTVTVKSVVDLSGKQIKQITSKLEAKLNRKINLKTEVDSSLLGGMIIEANDMVIDGSVRGKLQELGQALQS